MFYVVITVTQHRKEHALHNFTLYFNGKSVYDHEHDDKSSNKMFIYDNDMCRYVEYNLSKRLRNFISQKGFCHLTVFLSK